MTRSRAETLDYATAETRVGAPLREIVGASLAFAVASWVAALASDYWYFVGRREISADTGEAAIQMSWFLGQLAHDMVVQSLLTAVGAVGVGCVQWWSWRAWPRNRRSVWVLAAGCGVAHCAGIWGIHWLATKAVGIAGLVLAGAALVFGLLGLAAGAGLLLAWWRGR